MSFEVAQPHSITIRLTNLNLAKSVPNEAFGRSGIFCYDGFVHYVYILKLKDKTYYHGFSDDLKERIKDHEQGLVSSTKNLRPFTLEFYAAFSSKKKALDFETYLKTYSGFAFRNKHLIEK